MAITLPNGLKITAAEPVDNRLVLTKAEMLALKKGQMPDMYICICKDDGKMYVYDKSIETPDPEIGRFAIYEAPVDEEDMTGKLPQAIADAMTAEGGAEEICDALFDSDHFQTTVDNKIDIAISLIQAVDSN